MHTLHNYQEAAIQHLHQRMAAGAQRLYITLPTGTGKSLILATMAARRLEHGRVLVLIHRQEIALHLVQTLKRAGLAVGLLMQGHREMDPPVLVALVSSLTMEMLQACVDANATPVATILIDEAHHAVAGSAYEQIIMRCEALFPQHHIVTIGFTATPYRGDGRSMQDVLSTCAFARDLPEMVKAGWLAPLTWLPVTVDLDLTAIAPTQSSEEQDYADEDLARALTREAITEDIARQVVPRLEERPTLVFAASVEHAAQCAEAFGRHGLRAVAVSGRTRLAQRKRVFAAWRAGEIQVVCNCTLLTEGFDFPAIAALVLARPTLSPGLYVQMLGRGTRLAPGKQDCLVFDVMSAHPDRRQQVVLSHIVGVSHPAQGSRDRETNPRKASRSDAVLTALLGADTETGLALLDPIGQSSYRWTASRQGFFTMVSSECAAIIERDPTGSGLYRSRLYGLPRGQAPTHRWVKQECLPLREQVALVQQATETMYRAVLGAKDAPWLEEPASDKQLEVLARLHPKLARQAREQAWTKGKASQAITFCRLRRTLVYPPLWEQGSA